MLVHQRVSHYGKPPCYQWVVIHYFYQHFLCRKLTEITSPGTAGQNIPRSHFHDSSPILLVTPDLLHWLVIYHISITIVSLIYSNLWRKSICLTVKSTVLMLTQKNVYIIIYIYNTPKNCIFKNNKSPYVSIAKIKFRCPTVQC